MIAVLPGFAWFFGYTPDQFRALSLSEYFALAEYLKEAARA